MILDVENDRLVIELQNRDAFIEELISSQRNPNVCINYAKKVIKTRWDVAEKILLENFQEHKNINYIWNYTKSIKSRWPEAEPFIASSERAFEYAKDVVKGRWEFGENYFVTTLQIAREYKSILDLSGVADSKKIIENALLSSVEKKIKEKENAANSPDKYKWTFFNPADELYRYCTENRYNERYERWREAEKFIAKTNYAMVYAKELVKERWAELESEILNNELFVEGHINDYCLHVIKDRWPEAEHKMLKNSDIAYKYASTVVKGRWEEGEEVISKSPQFSYYYALNIVKGRWEEAEYTIANSFQYAYEYAKNIIKGRLPEVMHNIFMMNAASLSKDHPDYEYVNKYFTYKKYKKEIKRRKPVIINSK
jgi:hypothetical protein